MKLLIMFFSIFLDIFLLNVFKLGVSNSSYLFPMFTISSVVYISNYYLYSNRKNYYILILLLSVIYDTFVVNNLIITVTLFQIVAFLNIKLRKYLSCNLFNNLIFLAISILTYDLSFHLLLVLVGYQNFNLNIILYKLSHSLVINLVYMIIMFLVLKPKKA